MSSDNTNTQEQNKVYLIPYEFGDLSDMLASINNILLASSRDTQASVQELKTYVDAKFNLLLQAIQNNPLSGTTEVTELAERVARIEGMAMGRHLLLEEQKMVHREAATEQGARHTKKRTKKQAKIDAEIRKIAEFISTRETYSIGIIESTFKLSHGTAQRRIEEAERLISEWRRGTP